MQLYIDRILPLRKFNLIANYSLKILFQKYRKYYDVQKTATKTN